MCRRAGIRQKELAQHLNVTISTISHYESGTNVPNARMLVDLADYFCVSVDHLLGQTELNMDWNTFRREINLIDGTVVSLEAVVNLFLSLSEQNQSEIYRLINLFQMEDQLRRNSMIGEQTDDYNWKKNR